MQTDEFIDRVAQSTDVVDRDAARKVTFATIEALCLHLPKEETRQFTSQLPQELSQAALTGRHQATESPEERVELAQFYSEVAQRAEMDVESIQGQVRAVVNTLKKAITSGEYVDVTFDLPPELNALLAS